MKINWILIKIGLKLLKNNDLIDNKLLIVIYLIKKKIKTWASNWVNNWNQLHRTYTSFFEQLLKRG